MILFILAIAFLVTVHATKNGVRDYALAKQGQLPPRTQQAIEELRTAGQIATTASIAPQDAFRTIRKAGAGRAYVQRLADDAFDTLRERHEVKDAARRKKREAKRNNTYEPTAFEKLRADIAGSVREKRDRAFDTWTEKRQAKRAAKNNEQPETPVVEPGSRPAPQETHPEASGDTTPDGQATITDPPSGVPVPTTDPTRPNTEAHPTSESDPDQGIDPSSTGPASDAELENAQPKGDVADGAGPAGPTDRPADSPDSEDPEGQDEANQSTTNPTIEEDTATMNDQQTSQSHPDQAATASPAAQAGATAAPFGAAAGRVGGELTSQRALAMAEDRIAQTGIAVSSAATNIEASARSNGLDTTATSVGVELLERLAAIWSGEAQAHHAAASAASETVAAHAGHIARDLDFDVRD